MQKSKSGFTIVELIIVIVIIAILATITIVAYAGVQGRARDDRRKTDVAAIAKAMEIYYDDNGRYPAVSGSTTINASWASSIDASWDGFVSSLTANATDSVPTDPRNVPTTGAVNTGVMFNANNYSYAVYVNAGSYCGSAVGQMYIIVYRLETATKETYSDGVCTSNEIGTGYYNAGASYYRVAR
jgi:prepilin-type N-terminal cleavage/methylation domain-containing protein